MWRLQFVDQISHSNRLVTACLERAIFCLAFQRNRSDESTCANQARTDTEKTKMTNAEATTAADVAEQGATVAPEKASSKKRATQKKGVSKGQKAANTAKTKAAAPKKAA